VAHPAQPASEAGERLHDPALELAGMNLDDRQLHKIMVEQGHAPSFMPKTPRKKRSNVESQMQRALISWWHAQHKAFGVHEWQLFSIPNGGGRSGAVVGSILKAEGLRKGVPDVFLAVVRESTVTINPAPPKQMVPSVKWCITPGLFIEMKTAKGVVSVEQAQYHKILREAGYKVEVCWSVINAINVITAYLHG
jgi:hypothetical protein